MNKNPNFKKKLRKNILYFSYLFIVIIVALEIILRIYNPFHFRVKGDHIVLDVNKKFVIENNSIPALDKRIVWSKNSLGFRGPEKPADTIKRLNVFTVGGSTTECPYLSDGTTWSDKLYGQLNNDFKIWLNNAGMAGHSTFGHLALLNDYLVKLKPDVIIFLIGCNDIERDDLTESDESNMVNKYKNVFTFISKKSELCNLIINIFRSRNAHVKHLADTYIDFNKRKNDTIVISGEEQVNRLKSQTSYLAAYKNRVNKLITICRQNNIAPVLVTQPSVFYAGIDSLTGANLGLFKIDDKTNGQLWWQILELYNNVVRQIAGEQHVFMIDLAREMPKSSLYSYDLVHFTNAGTSKVSEILYDHLDQWMREKFPDYLKK